MKRLIISFITLYFCIVINYGNTECEIISSKELWKNKKKVVFKLQLIIGSDDLDKEEYVFGMISDVKVDQDGCIYVLDSTNFRVQKFSPKGKFLKSFGGRKGNGPGEFLRPKRIALDFHKNLYVADVYQSRITVFNQKGEIIKTIKTKVQPADIAIGRNWEFYITGFFDFSNFRVYKYDLLTGILKNTFCKSKKETTLVAKAGEAGSLCVDKEGNIYYSFFYPYEIRKFSPDGKLLKCFGRKAPFYKPPFLNQFGYFSSVSGTTALTVLPDGRIINVIKYRDLKKKKAYFYFDIFDKKGNWLLTFSSSELGLNWIRNVTSDSQGNLYLDCIDPYPHIRKYSMRFIEE
ncbi:NHL repeat-containing protein [Candidatus Aminicenantes bacterium AH-873-B07]|nr:NHL repeat-containing protein [Candidatus Aminicenantes bacterium AH-873-B07]